MRPYFALIKDSFRMVIASKVLYALLAIITLLLLVLAPLHVRESLDWQLFFRRNVPQPDELIQMLVSKRDDPKQPAVQRVWSLLSEDLQQDLVALENSDASGEDVRGDVLRTIGLQNRLQDELNELVKRRDFYQAEAWVGKRMNPEAREMLDAGVESLSDERSRRLNRLLMASAFPGLIQRGGGNSLEIWYGPWQWEELTANMSHRDFALITLTQVSYIFDKFVLSVGLFVAVLVTANFIPETFLPGSLNLLLSKPISRWGLLLAKFVGGCAFVSLSALYLFIGLWLWLGLAMGIWDRGILWAIPLYIVVFAIYYSVSTFVGVLSNSPILAIIVTAVFWLACFSVGSTHQLVERRLFVTRTRGLVGVEDQVLQIGELSTVSKWDEKQGHWQKCLEIKMMEAQRAAMGAVFLFVADAPEDQDLQTLGPVYDPANQRVVASTIEINERFNPNSQFLNIADAKNLTFSEQGKFPSRSLKLLLSQSGVLVVTRDGAFYRLMNRTPAQRANAEKSEVAAKGNSSSRNDSNQTAAKSTMEPVNWFQSLGPDKKINVDNKQHVAIDHNSEHVFVYRDSALTRFELNGNGQYESRSTIDFPDDISADNDAIIAVAGNLLVVALSDGSVATFDAKSFELRRKYEPQSRSPFRQVVGSTDGKHFVFRLRDNTAWLLDTDKPDSIDRLPVTIQGEIFAVEFGPQNRLWLATHANQVYQYDLKDMNRVRSLVPPMDWWTRAFNLVINPLYRIFPKPGEFYRLVTYLSATPDAGNETSNLNAIPESKNPWQPLWSGLSFMAVTLFISCLIFQYRDY